MTIPRDPQPPHRSLRSRKIERYDNDRIRTRDIVGGAHVILGAIGLVGLVVAFIFAGSIAASLPGLLALAATQGATVLSGLWLRDGRRRGAVLASVVGVLRVVLLVLNGAFGFNLVITVLLLVGVVYIWPTLTDAGE